MYFPSAPITSLSNPAEYTSLPRRKHVYLGETVQFLFILRRRRTAEKGDRVTPWKDLVRSLSARASVCVAERRLEAASEEEGSCGEESPEESEDGTEVNTGRGPDRNRTFRQSSALLIHNLASDRRQHGAEAVKARRNYKWFQKRVSVVIIQANDVCL